MKKMCPQCKTEKSIDDFYKNGKKSRSWCKSCLLDFQKDRWKSRKIAAVELMGGSCRNCGYDKCYAALEFHHEDPQTKEFNWNKVCKKSWEIITKELQKCVLLCSNCHRELHNPKQCKTLNNANNSLNKDISVSLDRKLSATGCCQHEPCCEPVYGTLYCSRKCASLGQKRKVDRPSKEVLNTDIKEMTWTAIGKKYGVSDNAVRKWAKAYGIL